MIYKLAGSIEKAAGAGNRIFHLHEVGNGNHQILAEIKASGAKARIEEYNLPSETPKVHGCVQK